MTEARGSSRVIPGSRLTEWLAKILSVFIQESDSKIVCHIPFEVDNLPRLGLADSYRSGTT